MKPASFNLFIRAMTAVGLVAVLFIGVGFIQPRMARANVPPLACSETPLFTNGTFVTGIGNGAGGADTSSPVSPDTGFGYLADPTRTQTTPDGVNRARLADDFTVTGNGWRPSAITLYAYQIGSTTTSPITGVVNLRLWNGTPGDGGTVIAGPVDGTIISNQWTNVYRVPANDVLQTGRPIMAVTIQWPFGNASLLPGTYWLEWGIAGDASLSGPWTPPTNAATGDNARQLNMTGGEPGTWAPRVDYSSGRVVGLPFVICGDPIPTPQITSLSPSSATAGGSAFTLTVNGSGFMNGSGSDRSIVYWNGSPRSTTFVSSSQLTAAIAASDIATAGTVNVTVVNPGNVTSNTATFTITNPVPTLTSMSPATATAGGAGFTLTVTGTNFVNGSVVRWNGSDRVTTFGSATELQASIPASDIATAGTASVTVFTPGPGGGETSALTFTITNPVPTLTSMSPATATAGGAGFTLTVTGTNFVNGSVVRWNGSDRTTTFGSATELQASIPASDIATAGTASVTVFTPGPGGGETSALTFTIENPVPTLTSMSPATATAGGAGFTLTVTGTNFVSGSVVRWNGSDRTTTFGSATELQASIPASDIATAGTASVTVFTPGPGGGETSALTFTIENPVPTLTSMSPATATAGGAGFTLTVTGTNFVSGSVVRWNGSDRVTTFGSATQLTAAIPASDIATAGTASVTVFTPGPGGGETSALTFTIENPVPTLTSMSPATATAGGAGFTLTVTGTNFVNGSVVRWNGSDRVTTFGSATELQASIPASDIATAGTASVTVFTPGPGGGETSALTFTIENPVPTLTSMSPATATAGGAGFTLTVTGTNFVSGSVVRWNGSDRVTTFGSATQLTAAIPASDIATAGTASVTVFTPGPGGGETSALTFTIENPVPTLTSMSPATATAGGAGFTLTVTGTNFVSGSVVRWNGSDRVTTFGSATQLTATIPASDIATAGTASVTVFTPGPGGGETSALTFTIENPVPTLTSMSPATATAGGAGFTLTVTGTNFVSGSVVRWNGSDRVTTFGSATQLTAAIPASDIATAGTASVTVFTPGPGGGETSALTFTIQSSNPSPTIPTITSVSPNSITVGTTDITLTINGNNFENGAVVRWNGTALATTFVSATQLTATLPAALRSTAGTGNVTVVNPGGGESNPVTVTIRYQVSVPMIMR